MLGYLRNNADSFFTKAILALISIVFIFFFGSGALNSPRSELVVEVNGETIREQEVNQAWRQAVRFQQQFNPNMTEAQQQQIKQEVLDRMIEDKLMLQAAREEGLVVSPKQLRRAVLEHPWFQDEEGNFDEQKYKDYLESSSRAEMRLQDDLAERAMLTAIDKLIRSGVQVSEAEVREAWAKENSKRNVEFVRVSTTLFRDEVTVEDGALSEWMGANEDAIKERYDRDFDRKYNVPKKVSARHILLKFGDEDTDGDRDMVRSKMGEILAEAKAEGADFAELAAKYSEDTSATRGGDLGFFDDKRMVAPFTEAAFSMEIGQISDLVETRYGVHIIKVEDITEAEVQALDDVRKEIATELYAEDQAPALAKAFAEKLVGALDGTMDEATADELLSSRNLTKQESGDFDGGARSIPKLGRAPEAVSAAFAMTSAGQVTPAPIEIPNGWVVMKLISASEPDDTAFADERGDVHDRLLRTRQTRALEAYKNALREQATIRLAAGA